jgi:hypothetical protein
VVRPALGQGRSGVLGHLSGLATGGVSVTEWRRDGHLGARSGVGARRLGARPRGVRRDDEPARGPALVASLTAVIASVGIAPMPGVPREGWRDHRRARAPEGGIRVIQPRGWRVGALSSWERCAAAIRYRGRGAC